MRLNRFLAAAGLGSRRQCDELIAEGAVTVNGQPCTNFSTQIEDSDHVKVGHRLVRRAETLTIVLHKPAGFVSTRHDPNATDTIYDLLPPKFSRLFNVGRLDAQTEGLLLLTSDGDLAQHLTHPRYKVEKEYEVTLDKLWDPKFAEKLRQGIFLDGKRARLTRVQQFWPYPFAGRPPTGAEPPDPSDVLRTRLRSEAPCPDAHRPSATWRNAARQLAPPHEKRTDRTASFQFLTQNGERRSRSDAIARQ